MNINEYLCILIYINTYSYLGFYADIWSLGILLFALLCGSFPFKALTEKELYAKILKGEFKIPENASEEVANLLKKLLIVNPAYRLRINEVINLI